MLSGQAAAAGVGVLGEVLDDHEDGATDSDDGPSSCHGGGRGAGSELRGRSRCVERGQVGLDLGVDGGDIGVDGVSGGGLFQLGELGAHP